MHHDFQVRTRGGCSDLKSLPAFSGAARSQRPTDCWGLFLACSRNRAHELLTLKRADRLTRAEQRELKANGKWNPDRLKGRSGVRYVVTGKGGMIRIMIVPHDLARKLEGRYVPGGFKT